MRGKPIVAAGVCQTSKLHCKFALTRYNMHLLSCACILVTLHLQHTTSLPATLKQSQQAAQMMDWNDIIKLDFSPHGIKKELNLDMGMFAVRSKQTLKFGAEVLEEETMSRRKRALNVVPEAAPCMGTGGGGGGGAADYDDVVGRRRSQKKSKMATRAKSMLNKLKKKKLVSEGELERQRRDVQDITDKAGELMEKAKKSFMTFINKVRKFSENVIERLQD